MNTGYSKLQTNTKTSHQVLTVKLVQLRIMARANSIGNSFTGLLGTLPQGEKKGNHEDTTMKSGADLCS